MMVQLFKLGICYRKVIADVWEMFDYRKKIAHQKEKPSIEFINAHLSPGPDSQFDITQDQVKEIFRKDDTFQIGTSYYEAC